MFIKLQTTDFRIQYLIIIIIITWFKHTLCHSQ